MRIYTRDTYNIGFMHLHAFALHVMHLHALACICIHLHTKMMHLHILFELFIFL